MGGDSQPQLPAMDPEQILQAWFIQKLEKNISTSETVFAVSDGLIIQCVTKAYGFPTKTLLRKPGELFAQNAGFVMRFNQNDHYRELISTNQTAGSKPAVFSLPTPTRTLLPTASLVMVR